MQEQLDKIKQLSQGSESDQRLAQDMMRIMTRRELPEAMEDTLYDVTIVQVSKQQHGMMFISEIIDLFYNNFFQRVAMMKTFTDVWVVDFKPSTVSNNPYWDNMRTQEWNQKKL